LLPDERSMLGYPKQVETIETLLIPSWEHHHPTHRATTRRTR